MGRHGASAGVLRWSAGRASDAFLRLNCMAGCMLPPRLRWAGRVKKISVPLRTRALTSYFEKRSSLGGVRTRTSKDTNKGTLQGEEGGPMRGSIKNIAP